LTTVLSTIGETEVMPEYGKKTVVELQEILKGRSLPHTGKKAELVARLNEADKSGEATTSMFLPGSARVIVLCLSAQIPLSLRRHFPQRNRR
jgi:SAP domain